MNPREMLRKARPRGALPVAGVREREGSFSLPLSAHPAAFCTSAFNFGCFMYANVFSSPQQAAAALPCPYGPMDKASAYGAEDSGFESPFGLFLFSKNPAPTRHATFFKKNFTF